ncbi:hypothetical protein BFP97_17910 [Roseivirga sp. 4D4]|nr:hypothetical protein BFP97_17910 [Roseivirga sp. 4D4]
MFFVETEAISQIGVITDSKGETSLQTQQDLILINAAEKSFGVSFGPQKYPEDKKLNWLVTFKAKGKKGISQLLKSGDFALDGSLSAPLLFPSESGNKFWYIIPELTLSRPKVYDAALPIGEGVFTDNNLDWNVSFGINDEKGSIKGLSLKLGYQDNTSLIKTQSIQTVNSQMTNGTTIVQVVSTDDAYNIGQFRKNNGMVRINGDYGNNFAKNRLLWMLHGRFASDQRLKPLYNLAAGLYVVKDGAPLEAVGGFQVQWGDIFQTRTEDNFFNRLSINLVVGIGLK